ncbi:MAG: hypothetical protein AAGK09_07395 [Planctomycetota bacterium]
MAYFDRVNTFCFFVSPARSGHSIIGQLLCAHPDVIVSDELGVVTMIDEGMSAEQVFALIRTQDLNLQARGRAKSGYDYRVGAAQNRTDKRPLVMGDAKGARATSLLAGDEAFAPRLREAMGVPIRAIVHLRNPFDIVGSRVKRRGRKLDEAIGRVELLHAELLTAVGRLADDERLIQHHEDVIADPAEAFRRMFAFLGVEPDERAVKACAAKLWQRPRTARTQADWSDDAVSRLRALIDTNPLLAPYREPARSFSSASVPAVATAEASTPARPRDEDRSGVFDRVERFVLLLSPHARGVVRLAGALSKHPELMIGTELVDGLYQLPCLIEPYDKAQLFAVIRHLSFLREAREQRDQGDDRRSVKVYEEIALRRPRVVGMAPCPRTLRWLAEQSDPVAVLQKRLGVPVLLKVWPSDDNSREGRWIDRVLQRQLVSTFDLASAQNDLAWVFDGGFESMMLQPDLAATEACVAAYRALPEAFTERLPAWVGPAAWLKSRMPGVVAMVRRG